MVPDIRALTGLRGFAALWVCAFHYLPNADIPALAGKLIQFGAQGVVVFFVLSGFILSYVYERTFSNGVAAESYKRFLYLRIARVYPLHFVTLLIVAGLVATGIQPLGVNDTAYTFALNLVALHAWGFTNSISWNLPSWSISIEAFAYLLLPFAIAPLYRMGAASLLITLLALFLFLWFNTLQFIAGQIGLDMNGVQFHYGISMLAFVGDFLIGAALFFFTKKMRQTVSAVWVYDASFLLGVSLIIFWSLTDSMHGMRIVVATTLIIFGLFRDAGIGKALLGNRPAVYLGEISYALYLSHNWLIYCWVKVLAFLAPTVAFHMVPLSVRMALAISLAAILHHAVERPARDYLRNASTGWRVKRRDALHQPPGS